jgi:hypothetical protein
VICRILIKKPTCWDIPREAFFYAQTGDDHKTALGDDSAGKLRLNNLDSQYNPVCASQSLESDYFPTASLVE